MSLLIENVMASRRPNASASASDGEEA